jgi:cyclic pyranopterin phosphate synthase
MPHEGVALKGPEDILSYEEIVSVVKVAAKLGIRKVRLTGGEPLARKDIETLVARLAKIRGIDELTMTTNGTLLEGMAGKLKAGGLGRVNISIDTLNPKKYSTITRGGELEQAIAGVDAAMVAGLTPIKINMVIVNDTTEDEIGQMERFCDERGLSLQKIMQFTLYDRKDMSRRFETERPPKCVACNRLRLTADGHFKPCLFSEREIKVDMDNIKASIIEAVASKPENGVSCKNRSMNQIGG